MDPTSTLSPSRQTTTEVKEAPTVMADAGQSIRINARFIGNPARVAFACLAPRTKKALFDPGVNMPGSTIRQDGDLFYIYIDTRGMRGGLGWWRFYSEDPDIAKCKAKVGRFIINETPLALYETPPQGESFLGGLGGLEALDLLGANGDDDHKVADAVVLTTVGIATAVGITMLLRG